MSSSISRLLFVLGGLTLATCVNAQPAPAGADKSEWQVYVCSHTHADYAWFDTMARCLDQNVAAIAKAVQMAEEDPAYRYTAETVLAFREYLARFPEKFQSVQKLLREGRLAVGALYTGPFEVSLGGEGLVRELYYGKRWMATHLGIETPIAWQPDVAGHTAQFPQILRKAGVRGLLISAGPDETRGPALFSWQARDGSAVSTWCNYYGAGDWLGWREPDFRLLDERMPRYIDGLVKNTTAFGLPKLGMIAEGMDLALPTGYVPANIREWNRQGRKPAIRHATGDEVFEAIARQTKAQPLPAFAGEMPAIWDSVQSQELEGIMLDRRLDGRVLAAEKFSALAGVLSPAKDLVTKFGVGFTSESGFYYPREDFDRVWQNRLLAYDHNYGGSHGAENDHLKAMKIQEADAITGRILSRAFETIASRIRFRDDKAPRIVVFNSLSFDRSDVVTWALPVSEEQARDSVVVDSNGRAVPYQRVPGSGVVVAFRADVPSLGHATYYLGAKQTQSASDPSPFQVDPTGRHFENAYFRLALDPATGGIKSIYDKRQKLELLRTGSRYAFKELVVYEDTEEDIKVGLTGKTWLMREHPSVIRVVENGPARLVVEVSGQLLDRSRRRQQIVLYPDIARIDLNTVIDWEGKENVQLYQSFPLAISSPAVKYAVPYGWQQFGQELKYAAPAPSNSMATHPWRAVRGWVEMADSRQAVTLTTECNLVAFRDLATAQPEPGYLIQPLLIRTVRSCGDAKLFYRQPGTHTFRFSIRPQADSPRAGAESDSPLLAYIADAKPASPSAALPDRFSFVQVKPANVQVAVLKRAEDGQGIVMRLIETKESSETTQAEVRAFRPVKSATRTSIIEENEGSVSSKDGAVRISLPPSSIETVRITF